jgi:glycosyltransferase involved in cell wall biosynthesis
LKKTRLLVDAHIFDKERQGTTTYIKGLYNVFFDLYKDEYEVFFCADNIEALQEDFPAVPSEQFIRMPKKTPIHRLFLQFPKIVKEYNIDYAHFQQIAPVIKNCKFIVTIHDLLFNDIPDKFSLSYRVSRNILFKNALRQSEIKLTVSQYSKDSIKQYYGFEDVEVTPNAISGAFKVAYNKELAQERIKEKYGIQDYILFVSRIEHRKNHSLLLKAFKALKLYKSKINLVFVGRNDIAVKELNEEIDNLSEEEKAYFNWYHFVSDEDLLTLYQGASMFVYPSLAEGFGIPPIEAAALGVNTLCSNLTAMRDFKFLEDNLFDPNDFQHFCELIQKNIDNPPSQEILENRKQKIYNQYNWEYSARVLHENIQKDLGK